MKLRRRNRRPLVIMTFFVVAGLAVFFGAQYIFKTGIFTKPGEVFYDQSLSSEELEFFNSIFTEDVKLKSDVTISAEYSFNQPDSDPGIYIYNIYVPVTDFYSTATNISFDDPINLFADPMYEETAFKMIPITDLSFKDKLLSLNGSYFLDDFTTGAVYRIIKFESANYETEIEPLVNESLSRNYPTKDSVLTFAQTGVTALSRGMNAKLSQTDDATYFTTNIGELLSSFDLTHTSNESSFSEMASSHNICSDNRFINTLEAIGLDIVELTGNHNQDCGDTAAKNTIDLYNEKGIRIVGGGKTATEAAEPLKLTNKNSSITFLAYNESTGGATDDDTPGANRYNEANAKQEISAAKERGDLVIVDIQYYECSAYASEYEDPTCDYANSSAGDQIGFFRHLADLGADIVVGTSAHQPQTFEQYEDSVIYYGLGNLFFDQIWWPGTTRSLILAHYIYNGKLLQTKIIPTEYDSNMQTSPMTSLSAEAYLERLISVRP